MFELINSRASIGLRTALIAACAAPPIALLLFLFVSQVSKDIRFTERELAGAGYIGEIWSSLAPAAAPVALTDPRAGRFGVTAEARAFDLAPPDARLAAAVVLIRAVGDQSGLTLDTQLDSYYAMDAATVKLPRLRDAMARAAAAVTPEDRAFALGQVTIFTDAADYDLRQAMRHDTTGAAKAALAGKAADLAAAVSRFREAKAEDPALAAEIDQRVDDLWKANHGELTRMLETREDSLKAGITFNLTLVVLALGFALVLMIAGVRGLNARLRGLLRTMDRLNDGDTSVEIPYLSDRNETGRIAATLEAFRRGMVSLVEKQQGLELANAALRRSEARYRLLADNVTDIIVRHDLDGTIEYVSASIRRLGYQPQDLVGRPTSALIHPDDHDRVVARRARVLAGEPGGFFEGRILLPDGSNAWVESNLSLIRDDQGNVVGAVAVMRDINERKTAEAALLDSEERYRLLADYAMDTVIHCDLDGRILYVSPSVRQYGYRPEDLVGEPIGGLVHPEDLATVRDLFDDVAQGRPGRRGEWRLTTTTGQWCWVEGGPFPITDSAGVLTSVLGVMRNVDDRKATERALEDMNVELMRVARVSALGALATSIAHEINQPLAAVVTHGQTSIRWLAKTPPDYEKAAEAIGRAARDAIRASEVVGRMRSMVTKDEPRDIEFDVGKAITEVLTLTRRERQDQGVEARVSLAKRGPMILGDRVQFQQVMLNLILNAIEAMRDTDPADRQLMVRTLENDNGDIQVEVADRGPGIDPAVASRIFDHLFTTKSGGSGLGLAISKSIVENLGGEIWAESSSAQGAVFRFSIPSARRRDEPGASRTKSKASVAPSNS
ncbi:MAG: multi-sensor signal transduction multi-kinase [Caulobacteraceae bacterium]|nr:multi-sensor signal transduction multi-kinase [Caulobacteraceae bacterium]